MLRVSGTLQKSGEVMKLVNDTLKLPELQKTMFRDVQRCDCSTSGALSTAATPKCPVPTGHADSIDGFISSGSSQSYLALGTEACCIAMSALQLP